MKCVPCKTQLKSRNLSSLPYIDFQKGISKCSLNWFRSHWMLQFSKSKWIIICGDFNINYHDQSPNEVKTLLNIFHSKNLSNNGPFLSTRICTNKNGHTTSTCIDYIVTNSTSELCQSNIVNHNIADHLSNMLTMKIETVPQEKTDATE